MAQVNCLYCGNEMSDEDEKCPHCGKNSHFKKKNKGVVMSQKHFYLLFGLVALLCAVLVFWFPRDIA